MSPEPRVRIQQLTARTLAELADGDLEAARASSGLPLTPYLVGPEAIGTWCRRAVQVLEAPIDLAWVAGVIIDAGTGDDAGMVVGRAGFHAAPDPDGLVEVGYAVAPEFRRRGYARAALLMLLERARREPAVCTLRLTVSPDNHASLGLVRSLPFVEVGEQWDDEDGLETIYELPVDRPLR